MAVLAVTVLSPLFKPQDLWVVRHVTTIIWSGIHGICALTVGDNLPYVTREDPKILAEDLVRGYLAGLDRTDLTSVFRKEAVNSVHY